MPGRPIPLITDEIYHIFNRGIDHRPTFMTESMYRRAFLCMDFYRFSSPPTRLSYFLIMPMVERERIMEEVQKRGQPLVEFLCFCLMPNHFHFLLRQAVDNGISQFLSKFQNSFTRFFNTKRERVGPLFLDQFKAVRMETDEQLIHVSRYIHLNPYSSFVVKDLKELENYKWSSLPEYLGKVSDGICNTDFVLSLFKNKNEYKKFIFNQADYQRKLDMIKHLTFE